MTYEIVGLTQYQARQLADVLCGTAVFADGHAWISEVCVVRPQGCQCPHCLTLSGHPTGNDRT